MCTVEGECQENTASGHELRAGGKTKKVPVTGT
jgi:hypothetical protein